ncbi:CAP domain-containing protein [Seonamhaeicola marinus]|uniref:CAP domain-containing protein n=1 Tax=Seonamhaeicola marinus TaxID=1912246 RepID=A0A5D0HSR2_9FLAO|nr:CAP domain-containing protein [Seonamhaeicola marinus]TYA74328.1 CAP domain-containing protein [Seonamhaeicola marinus]
MKTYFTKISRLILCAFIVIAAVSCSKDSSVEDDVEQLQIQSMEEEILQLVNSHRESLGYNPLRFNDLANTLAYEHTTYMISQNDISHDDFDDRADRLFDDENARGVGENVAYGQQSAQAVMTAWLNSPGHRRNIEGDFTHIGIAVIRNANGVYYFTQLFLKKPVESGV